MIYTTGFPHIPYNIKVPRPVTLSKYGLDLDEWVSILAKQGYECAICHKIPSSGRFVIDHLHVQNYKKLKPERKRLWVRGVICTHCNRFYLAKGINIDKAQAIVKYLTDFEQRRPR